MNRFFQLGNKHKDISSPSSPKSTKKSQDKGGSLDRKNASPADMQKFKSPVREKDAHSSSSSYYHSSHQHSQPNMQACKHSTLGSHSTTKNNSEDENSSILSGSGKHGISVHLNSGHSSASPLQRDLFNELLAQVNVLKEDIQLLHSEMQDRKDENQRISEEFETFKSQLQSEYSIFHQNLQEERYRFERLEEQMNDLIELHQNEIENLKQGMVDMEEKVQYQSEERTRDIYELLEAYQTRIFRMEHQQQQQFQQLVNIDSLENSNARVFVLKLINVLLTFLQVILLIVATVASIIVPFIKTRFRVVTTFVFIFMIFILYRNRIELADWTADRLDRHFPQFVSLFK